MSTKIKLLNNKEDKQSWDEAKRAEYEAIFPKYKELGCYCKSLTEDREWYITNDEYNSMDTFDNYVHYLPNRVEEINYISIETITDEDGKTFTREVRTPSNYLTYDEWANGD